MGDRVIMITHLCVFIIHLCVFVSVVRVLNDLMHSDDLSSGTLRIARKSVNMWRLVQTTVDEFRSQASKRGVSLSLAMAVDAAAGDRAETLQRLRVVGDERRLEQVVGMLVGNAVRSVERGGQVAVTGNTGALIAGCSRCCVVSCLHVPCMCMEG